MEQLERLCQLQSEGEAEDHECVFVYYVDCWWEASNLIDIYETGSWRWFGRGGEGWFLLHPTWKNLLGSLHQVADLLLIEVSV